MERYHSRVRFVLACLVTVWQLFPTVVNSYSTGAPAQACSSLTPNHGVGAQPSSSLPYMIDIEVFRDPVGGELVYTPGVTYNSKLVRAWSGHQCMIKQFCLCMWLAVTLLHTSSATFRGFLIQARMTADSSTLVGRFSQPSAGADYEFLTCSGLSHVTIDQ